MTGNQLHAVLSMIYAIHKENVVLSKCVIPLVDEGSRKGIEDYFAQIDATMSKMLDSIERDK